MEYDRMIVSEVIVQVIIPNSMQFDTHGWFTTHNYIVLMLLNQVGDVTQKSSLIVLQIYQVRRNVMPNFRVIINEKLMLIETFNH